MLVEMRDKLAGADIAPALGRATPGSAFAGAKAEARHALIALGYKPAEAERLLTGIDDDTEDSEGLIREALKRAVR
jgi:Holliday junction DNA helicase RuvA